MSEEQKVSAEKIKKSEKTRRNIVNSYLDLMSEKRWDKINVKELCTKCNITRSTFYQYYNDIYDLMETLENSLLDEITTNYEKVSYEKHLELPEQVFINLFDYSPAQIFIVWFKFVQRNQKAVFALLDRKKGDTYFVKRLKNIMTEYINRSMDSDGFPRDELRNHFIKLILEMHFHAAQIWVEEGFSGSGLDVAEIIHLLNAMRVGACFLSFKSRSDPDFANKMDITDQISF